MPALSHRDIFRRLRAERDAGDSEATGSAKPVDSSPPPPPLAAPSEAPSGSTGVECVEEDPAARREAALISREEPTIAGPLRVLEDPEGVWAGGNGATVWDCARLLAGFLQLQSGVAGAQALELGSGTGLVGMCLAKLGARTVLTERPLALPLLRRNVAENRLDTGSEAARVEELTWGSASFPDWAHGLAFDIVVGSDLVFPNNAECHDALIETLRAFVGPETRCWLGYEPRKQSTDEAFMAALGRHFNVRRESEEDLPANSPPDLWVLRLSATGYTQG